MLLNEQDDILFFFNTGTFLGWGDQSHSRRTGNLILLSERLPAPSILHSMLPLETETFTLQEKLNRILTKYIYFAHWYLEEHYTMNHLDMQVPHRSQPTILILYPTSFQQMLQPDCKYSINISCFPTLELLLTVFSTVFSFLISTLWNLIFLSTLR